VRQAMVMLLDREAMMRDIWVGIGQVAKGPFNPSGPASDPNLKPWPFDPEKAKALLAEAGWTMRDGSGVLKNEKGDEFAFEFTRSSGGEIYERIAKYIVDQCAKAGIRCNVRVQDWSVYTETLKNRDFDAIIMGWGANSPESDVRQMFHSKSIENQGDNFVQWSDPEADRLMEEGLKELDFEKRMAIWKKLEAVLAESQPYCFVRVPPWLRFISRRFDNVNMYPKGLEPWEYFVGSKSLPEKLQ
jgi:peptide/nickel transport system substrate-binding protein